MTKIVITLEDGKEEVFENTIGHQVGYGAAQLMLNTGEQVVFNNFKRLEVQLTEEERKEFMGQQAAMKAKAEAQVEAQEAAYKKQMEDLEALDESDETIIGEDSPSNKLDLKLIN